MKSETFSLKIIISQLVFSGNQLFNETCEKKRKGEKVGCNNSLYSNTKKVKEF